MVHHFVEDGGEATPAPESTNRGLLATVQDWQLKVHRGRQLKFPGNIAESTLRPDTVLVAEATRQVVLLELTIPMENWMEEYEEQAGECQSRGVEDLMQPH